MTASPARRPPTRADVARYAGVSGAVVSYVINNGPRPVAPQTAERVRAAIDILGYRPNLTARALKGGSTQILGMILSDISNPFFAEFAVEVENTAAAHGHAVLIGNSHGNAFIERRLIDDLMSRQVAGLVLASVDARPEMIDRAVKVGIPTVLVDCPWPVNGHFSLGPDSRAGARLVVDHLIQVHHHRVIAMVVGAEGNGGDPRERSWQEATRAAALLDGPLVRMPFTREGGYLGGQRLLGSLNPPSAIFASSDLQAIGVLRAVRERGLRVPEDVALVSFDGTQDAEFCWPPLTVARQPVHDMATRAVAAVLSAEANQTTHQSYPMELIIRQSCGCPADA